MRESIHGFKTGEVELIPDLGKQRSGTLEGEGLAPFSADYSNNARMTTVSEPASVQWWHEGDVVVAVVSGVVCSLTNITLNLSLAAVVFTDAPKYMMLAFDIYSLGVMCATVGLAVFSTCPAYMGCPNAVAAVTFSNMVASLAKELDGHSGDALVPTVLMAMSLCTFVTGLAFWILGHLRLTKLARVLPQPVMCGFLAVIGSSLMKSSVKIGGNPPHSLVSKQWIYSGCFYVWGDFWRKWWPVPMLGIPFFMLQRKSSVSPPILWGMFLTIPIVLFYVGLYIMGLYGEGFDATRASFADGGFFMEKMEETEFYDIWKKGWLMNLGEVRWRAVLNALWTFLPLVPAIVVDVLVGMAVTRKAINIEPDLDKDSQITGGLFLVESCLSCPLTTNSGKLSLINASLVGKYSRIPSLINGGVTAFLFFQFRGIGKYAPRFYLGFILLSNALGFVVKNLYDSRHHMTSKMEMVVPWIMVYIEMEAGFGGAIVAGCVSASLIFAFKYAEIDCVKSFTVGRDARRVSIPIVRTPQEEACLKQLGQQLIVVKLHQYLFFGSVLQVDRIIEEAVKVTQDAKQGDMRSRALCPRWLVLDWEDVRGMDATLATSFAAAVQKLVRSDLRVVMTGMLPGIHAMLGSEGALAQVTQTFSNLFEGIAFVESELLARSAERRMKLCLALGAEAEAVNSSARLLYQEHVLLYLIGGGAAREVWRYARRRIVSPGEAVCSAGIACKAFYIVQSGRLRQYDGDGRFSSVFYKGACFNEWALLFDCDVATHTVIAEDTHAVVLEVTSEALKALESRDAAQVKDLHRLAMQQAIVVQETAAVRLSTYRSSRRSIGLESQLDGEASQRRRSKRPSIVERLGSRVADETATQAKPATEALVRECFAVLRESREGRERLASDEVLPALVTLGLKAPNGYDVPADGVSEAEFVALATTSTALHTPGPKLLERLSESIERRGSVGIRDLVGVVQDLSTADVEQLIIDADVRDIGDPSGNIDPADLESLVHTAA